jgi:alpha-beta hydrolase superfamily lysophospholipase
MPVSHESLKVELKTNNEKLYVKALGLQEFKKQVIIFHDIGEYHFRYLNFGYYLNNHDIGVIFIDMRGHGLSSGTRGHADSYEVLVEDYRKFWNQFSAQLKDKEIYVLGHGVGSFLALSFMLNVPEVKGSILVNPTVQYNESHNHSLEDFAGNYSLLRKLRLSYNSLGRCSKEMDINQNLNHDPLVNKKLTVGMFHSINKMIEELKRMSYFVTRPIMMVLGNENMVIDLEKARLFAASFDKNVLQLKEYSDCGHEVFNEIDRENIFVDIVSWIEKNSK